jgi:kinesin family protein 6/9
MMTSILRDSLGGNCRTVMIANLSLALENEEETVSTARFAIRC